MDRVVNKRTNDNGRRILAGLDEVATWLRGECALMLTMPDGTSREMTADEYRELKVPALITSTASTGPARSAKEGGLRDGRS